MVISEGKKRDSEIGKKGSGNKGGGKFRKERQDLSPAGCLCFLFAPINNVDLVSALSLPLFLFLPFLTGGLGEEDIRSTNGEIILIVSEALPTSHRLVQPVMRRQKQVEAVLFYKIGTFYK